MGKPYWKLVPKLHPDHVAQAEEVRKEREQLRKDLRSFGLLGSLLWPPVWDKKAKIKKRLDRLERWFVAALAPVGYELDPPCIGKHEHATKWFRERMDEDPDNWPFPPDQMVEEMTGQPVWELHDNPLLQQLDVGWPKAVMHVPRGPGFSLEFLRTLERDLPASETQATAKAIQQQVQAHFERAWPEYAEASAVAAAGHAAGRAALEKLAKSETPEAKARREADVDLAREAIVASEWLHLWGGLDYGFELGETEE